MYAFLLTVLLSFALGSDVPSLPYCPENYDSGLLIVSTLDGKLTALHVNGSFIWELDTGPGPLLLSNIHNMELTNNGEWIRIIPSLTGILYKFDGVTIDPIPISAEDLLKSSFVYSDDLVIAGGIEVRTYGVGFRTGTLFYECSSLRCSNNGSTDDDVLLVERSTRTIRAVEPRTGTERWNFSVGLHNIKLPRVSCINVNDQLNLHVSAIIPEGKLFVSFANEDVQFKWQYSFVAPIVKIWKWTGKDLLEIDIFSLPNIPQIGTDDPIWPSIYIGMHLNQLYVHESEDIQTQLTKLLNGKVDNLEVVDSTSIVKIPWKPIPASPEKIEEDSTSLSVLNGSEYVNGHGFYLYSHSKLRGTLLCEPNNSYVKNFTFPNTSGAIPRIMILWWKEMVLFIITFVVCHILFKYWNQQLKNTTMVNDEKVVKTQIPDIALPQLPDNKQENFISRFENDFETIQCLGKGGFGVVFEVKQNIDECNYAIKRIVLPNELKSRDSVLREVKALAKLEHQNIIRYFNSWVENPPVGWQQEHDKKWLIEKSFEDMSTFTSQSKVKRTRSVCIDIPLNSVESEISIPVDESDEDDDDSFIVFEKPDDDDDSITESKKETDQISIKEITSQVSNSDVESHLSSVIMSEHLKKKIDWKKPDRKHYSWDVSLNNLSFAKPIEPPVYLYIQMQLCQKESLKDWLGRHHARDYKVIQSIFLQILDAVEYVHLRGLIHRDLKPSNIFFSLDGQVKVGDFGLVKDAEDAFDLELIKKGASPSYRGHTLEVGTQLYMSPEQFKSRIYDYKVDIYSLGLIFFELLVPFSTDMERIKLLTNIKKDKYPADFCNKFLNEHNLLQNMLSEDPNKRLTTIGIKARPPFNIKDLNFDESSHFRLNSFSKV